MIGLYILPMDCCSTRSFIRIFQILATAVKSREHSFYWSYNSSWRTSLFYEWIEWLIAIGLSPEEAENYNGQQGDIWDTHKDMLLATLVRWSQLAAFYISI